MASLGYIEDVTEGLVAMLQRKLVTRIQAIEAAKAYPVLYGGGEQSFVAPSFDCGDDGESVTLQVDHGTEYTATVVGDDLTAADVVAALNADWAASGVTASVETAHSGSADAYARRIVVTHDTAAVEGSPRALAITAGSSTLGLEVGDISEEIAVPSSIRHQVHWWDPRMFVPPEQFLAQLPAVYFGPRTGTPQRLGTEQLHDFQLALYVACPAGNLTCDIKQAARVVQAIAELLAPNGGDPTVDGRVATCRAKMSPVEPVPVMLGEDAFGVAVMGRVDLFGRYGE